MGNEFTQQLLLEIPKATQTEPQGIGFQFGPSIDSVVLQSQDFGKQLIALIPAIGRVDVHTLP